MKITLHSVKLENNKLITLWAEKGKKEKVLKEYDLKRTSKEELFKYRLSGRAGFVLKKNDELFFAPIPQNCNMFLKTIVEGTHMCNQECKRLSAKQDSQNGCAKVRSLFMESYIKDGFSLREAATYSKRIEEYDFIVMGYQTFGTENDCLVVFECKQYVKGRTVKKDLLDIWQLKLSLAEFVDLPKLKIMRIKNIVDTISEKNKNNQKE